VYKVGPGAVIVTEPGTMLAFVCSVVNPVRRFPSPAPLRVRVVVPGLYEEMSDSKCLVSLFRNSVPLFLLILPLH
jgi:hypothetical protein